MSDNKSKIIKRPFVAMSDIRKEIVTIDPKDPNILKKPSMKNVQKASLEAFEDGEWDDGDATFTTEDVETGEAINDEVIDGSYAIMQEEIRAEIEAEMKSFIEEAKLEAETIKEAARQEGYDMGFNEGQQAANDILSAKERELEMNAQALAREFEEAKEQYVLEMEPRIANLIRDLLAKMIGRYEEDPGIIMYLIKLALEEVHTYGSFIIKVSPDDYDYVMEHKEAIVGGISEKVSVEILKDVDMTKNQCFIETEMGNIDCSLSLRVDSLMKELKLIADSLK